MEGECNCGAVSVKVTDPNLFSTRRGHVCHCFNCRKTAGSALGSTNLIIEADKVEMSGTENLTLYEDPKSLSGNTVKRYFCKTCGNPIKSETEAAAQAGKVILKLGIFDKIPAPEFESFTDHRQHWATKHHGAQGYKITLGAEKDKHGK